MYAHENHNYITIFPFLAYCASDVQQVIVNCPDDGNEFAAEKEHISVAEIFIPSHETSYEMNIVDDEKEEEEKHHDTSDDDEEDINHENYDEDSKQKNEEIQKSSSPPPAASSEDDEEITNNQTSVDENVVIHNSSETEDEDDQSATSNEDHHHDQNNLTPPEIVRSTDNIEENIEFNIKDMKQFWEVATSPINLSPSPTSSKSPQMSWKSMPNLAKDMATQTSIVEDSSSTEDTTESSDENTDPISATENLNRPQ